MSLNTFKWNNGSPTSPIVLTNEDIEILIEGKTKVSNYEVKGYITTSTGKMYKFIKETLNTLFPDLHIIKANGDPIEELADEFTISIENDTLNEGKSMPINITGGSITHDYLNYAIEYITEDENIVTSGNISAEIIKSRINIEHGIIKVAAPQENAEWAVEIKITAYPKYYEGTELKDIPAVSRPYVNLLIQGIAINSITLNLPSEIPINTVIPFNIIPNPSNSTKLAGAIYTFGTNTTQYVSLVGGEPKTKGTVTTSSSLAQLSVDMRLSGIGNAIASDSATFTIYDLRPTCFIIDQRGLNNMLDSRIMVGGNFYIDNEGNKQNLSAYAALDSATRNTIKWIRDNSHLYVGQWDGSMMRLRQLKDDDKTKFVDGTSAEAYITGTADNNAFTYDVFLKFKSDIYIKTEADIPIGNEVADTNYIRVTISKDQPTEYVNANNSGGWIKFSQYSMPGVYKMYVKNNQARSISGVIPTRNITQSTSILRTRIRGMRLVNYDIHKLLAYLFYGYYGTLNSQDVCGSGTNTIIDDSYYAKKTGLCNGLGMTDTTNDTGETTSGNGTVDVTTQDGQDQIIAGYGTDIKSVNFWGLENWWGDIYEWMDDLTIMQAKRPSSVATADPNSYMDDYINTYLAAHPSSSGVQVTKEGVDFTLTPELIADYAEETRFIKITDITGSNIIRIIQTPFTSSVADYSKQMQHGKYADLIPKAFGGSSTTCYADFFNITSINRVARRSYGSNKSNGGVTYMDLYFLPNDSGTHVGSRLLFEGTPETVEIVDNF